MGAAGETGRPGVFAAGSMTARMSCEEAAEIGSRAGAAAAAHARAVSKGSRDAG